MDQGLAGSSVLAALVGWVGHWAFGDVHWPTWFLPPVGHATWDEPDAAPCETCAACTCEEELHQLLSQQAALERWRLAAAVLGVIAGVAGLLVLLLGLCLAGGRGGCCRQRGAAGATRDGHAPAQAATGGGRCASACSA
ncbi:unnamed protein product [Prorocentrum cordatum]|uniref:Uncharacterized protein n=1 Tax=Prorocentrum cordatum TaxID=2364126 RepID=A0ABN9TM53_9DINO|nr:unnamed protein product [Polarella glacialis]